MQVIRVGRLAGRDADNLNIERVSLAEVSGLRLAAQCLRNLLAGADEFSLG